MPAGNVLVLAVTMWFGGTSSDEMVFVGWIGYSSRVGG